MNIEEYKKITKKKSKYRSEKTEYNGMMFDSKKEADFAKNLESRKHAHELNERVTRVEYQVAYPITAKNKVVSHYFADFRITYADLHQEVVDVKGMKTPVYKLKKKLVEALHDIKIIEF
jgi:hypothetical protein